MIDPYELLGRHPIIVNPDVSYLTGKRVLVTGAGGSIGSVLARRLATLDIAELIMLDRDESALHALQLGITGRALLNDSTTVLGDIRDFPWMKKIMVRRRPDIVFHAAALKHQPLLQQYPGEAVKTNIIGTENVLKAAVESGVEQLVNVSTDKAATTTCVLGCSKRIAERIVARYSPSRFVSVRFGNVLNSRGSVLETFLKQLESGVPLTVTDVDARRYFLSADEAVDLLVQAGATGMDGEVMVMDMGEPVWIDDIARKLIKYSDKGTQIIYTGLRPGEKLCEQLLDVGERGKRLSHPLIRQVESCPLDSITFGDLDGDAESLAKQLHAVCNWRLR